MRLCAMPHALCSMRFFWAIAEESTEVWDIPLISTLLHKLSEEIKKVHFLLHELKY